VFAAAAIAGKPIAEAGAAKPPAFALIVKPSGATAKPKGASACIVSPKTAAVMGKIGPVQKIWLIKLQGRRRFVVKARPRSNPEPGDDVIFAADGGSL
jgi:hypothetical protein